MRMIREVKKMSVTRVLGAVSFRLDLSFFQAFAMDDLMKKFWEMEKMDLESEVVFYKI